MVRCASSGCGRANRFREVHREGAARVRGHERILPPLHGAGGASQMAQYYEADEKLSVVQRYDF